MRTTMSARNRGATYGRKKANNDLLSAFGALRLSPQHDEERQQEQPKAEREILKERSNNEGRGSRDIKNKEHEASKSNAICQSPPKKSDVHAKREPRKRAAVPKKKTATESPSTRSIETNHDIPPQKADSFPIPPELLPLLSLQTTNLQPQTLGSLYETLSTHFAISKISQGSYASIYRLALHNSSSEYTIWKLIPLRPVTGRGSRAEGCTSFTDAVAEIKMLNSLSAMPGYVEMRSTYLLHGPMPTALQDIEAKWWDTLNEKEQDDLGESHGQKRWEDGQWWCFIEMSDAGQDLESLLKERSRGSNTRKGKVSMEEVWDIFWGVTEAIAHGEDQAGFEHRDLHPGNVCIRKCPLAINLATNATEETDLDQDEFDCLIKRFTDLEITLIDYTLSRAEIAVPNANPSSSHDHSSPPLLANSDVEGVEREVLANSLRDASLFSQHSSDPVDERQFDTYRRMREIMHRHHKPARRKGGWRTFMPETNVAWLGHLLWVLLDAGAFFGQGDECDEIVKPELNRSSESREGLGAVWRLLDPEREGGEGAEDFASAGELLAWQVLGSKGGDETR